MLYSAPKLSALVEVLNHLFLSYSRPSHLLPWTSFPSQRALPVAPLPGTSSLTIFSCERRQQLAGSGCLLSGGMKAFFRRLTPLTACATWLLTPCLKFCLNTRFLSKRSSYSAWEKP